MRFLIRPAQQDDVSAIAAVMRAAMEQLPEPDWFVPDDEEYLRAHLAGRPAFARWQRQWMERWPRILRSSWLARPLMRWDITLK